MLVEDVHAVLLPGLPDAAPPRDDRRGLVGIEHVEADLAGVGDDGVLPVGLAADHPRDLDHEGPVDELHRGKLEVGVGGEGGEVHARRGEHGGEDVVPPAPVGLRARTGSRYPRVIRRGRLSLLTRLPPIQLLAAYSQYVLVMYSEHL